MFRLRQRGRRENEDKSCPKIEDFKVTFHSDSQCDTLSRECVFMFRFEGFQVVEKSSARGHKFLPIDSRGDRGDRRGAMAVVEVEPGR